MMVMVMVIILFITHNINKITKIYKNQFKALDELSLKAYISETYSRVYIDNLISNYYNKSKVDSFLNLKLDSSVISNYYDKNYIDTALSTINSNIRSEVDNIFNQV